MAAATRQSLRPLVRECSRIGWCARVAVVMFLGEGVGLALLGVLVWVSYTYFPAGH